MRATQQRMVEALAGALLAELVGYLLRPHRWWLVTVWHPDCPGTTLTVWRNGWQMFTRPRNFATLGEVLGPWYRPRC